MDAIDARGTPLGHPPELVPHARQPPALPADRGTAHRAARRARRAGAAHDQPDPPVRHPGRWPGRARSSSTRGPTHDLRRLRARPRTRRHRAPVPGRRRRPPRRAAGHRPARPGRAGLRGRREQHDRQHPRPRRVRRAVPGPRRARCTSTTRTASASSASGVRRDLAVRHAAATPSSGTTARATTTSCWSAASPRRTRHCWPSWRCPTPVKKHLKIAAPPYLYSGPAPTASLATVLAGLRRQRRPRRGAPDATCTA